MYNTHVYAVVRITVTGTNFSNSPQEVAQNVAEAVCAKPSAWLKPVHGSIFVDGHGEYEIKEVEFADEIAGMLVDEINTLTDDVVAEYDFDSTGNLKHK